MSLSSFLKKNLKNADNIPTGQSLPRVSSYIRAGGIYTTAVPIPLSEQHQPTAEISTGSNISPAILRTVHPGSAIELNDALLEHCAGDFHETGDVGTLDIVHIA